MSRMLRLRLSHNPLYEEMIGRIIDLPKIMDPRGNLTVAEGDSLVTCSQTAATGADSCQWLVPRDP